MVFILIFAPSVFARSLTKSLSAIAAFNKPNKLACQINGDDDSPLEALFSCQPPQLKASACTRQELVGEPELESYKRTNIVEMDCSVCGLNIHTIGKINSYFQDDFDDQSDFIFDFREGSFSFTHMTTETDFNLIKKSCIDYIEKSSKGHNVAVHDLQNYIHNFDQLFQQDQSYSLPIFKSEIAPFTALPGNGKLCKELDEEKTEVQDYIQSLKPKDDGPGSKPIEHFSQIITKDGRPFNVPGFDRLTASFNYLVSRKAPINGFIPEEKDLNQNTHHLFFDESAPKNIEQTINNHLSTTRLLDRVINPRCDTGKSENLIISVNGQKSVQRYQMNCQYVNRKKIITLNRL